MASGKKWRETDTIKFVKLYEEAECLWNFRHPGYKIRNARDKACQNIVRCMDMPDFGINELKNKIKNIRSTYQQEVNKIKRFRNGVGDHNAVEEYKTNLAWFPIADRFLSNVINSTKNLTSNQLDIVNEEDTTVFKSGESDFYNLVETEISDSKDLERKLSPSYFSTMTVDHCQIKEEPAHQEEYTNSMLLNNNKRKRTHELQVYDDTFGDEVNSNSGDKNFGDEFFHFGNNVASQLRKLPLERALRCQQQIIEILTNQRILALKENNNRE